MTPTRTAFVSILLIQICFSEIIPRELLFSDAKYTSVSLSPDGRHLGYISVDDNGVKNVFVKCINCKSERQVTFEKQDAVLSYSWTALPDIIIYTQDNEGDENTRLYKKNISSEAVARDKSKRVVISEQPRVKASIMANNQIDPFVIIGLNDENPAYHNVYLFDLNTNQLRLLMRNNRFPMFVIDNSLRIRLASEELPNGDIMYYKPSRKYDGRLLTSDKEDWTQYLLVPVEDKPTTAPISFDQSNENMFWMWGEASDLGTLVKFPFEKPDQQEVLYQCTRAQIGHILFHPTDRTLLAVSEVYHKPELLVSNETVIDDLQYLVNLRPHGSLQILSLSQDMNTWLVTYMSSDRPFEVFVYRRWVKTAELLFNTHPQLEKFKMNRQIGFDFKTRDDLVLQAYLSLPTGAPLKMMQDVPVADKGYAELGMIPEKPQKMVILVHGGPKARDIYGFSPLNAWLTSRGYAVLQVNFRGSTGFGKRLTNAGNGEWGRKMHYDILDALEFTIAKGIANRSEVAIMGGSYGGYETLVALTFTPDAFACGIDIVGPSNLVSLMEAVPPYWRGFYQDLVKMLGADITSEEGKESLISRSPLFYADQVKKPIMIMQGANDPRVKQAESDQFVKALKTNNIPVTYVLYPDEGHGFRKSKNQLAKCGFIEHFLSQCLGGAYEPFHVGQYNSTAILKSDGYAPKPLSTTLTPTTVPVFYRPLLNRFQVQQPRPTNVVFRPINAFAHPIFPQHG
ncbi:unnamed protein product [Auanema sp. JU1783]|nr:unnamed protein product [Auanema sp. JU1783]